MDLSHDIGLILTNCMCNLESVRRFENFSVHTEYSDYAVIAECSYVGVCSQVSEIRGLYMAKLCKV